MSSHKHSCALICTHEHSQALLSKVVWHHERSRVLMRAHILMVPYLWLLLSSHDYSLPMVPSSWVFMAAPEYILAIRNTHGVFCLLMNTHESSRAVMKIAPWGHWRLSALMSPFGVTAPYSWLLLSAHECLWELDYFIKQETKKMLAFKMIPL